MPHQANHDGTMDGFPSNDAAQEEQGEQANTSDQQSQGQDGVSTPANVAPGLIPAGYLMSPEGFLIPPVQHPPVRLIRRHAPATSPVRSRPQPLQSRRDTAQAPEDFYGMQTANRAQGQLPSLPMAPTSPSQGAAPDFSMNQVTAATQAFSPAMTTQTGNSSSTNSSAASQPPSQGRRGGL